MQQRRAVVHALRAVDGPAVRRQFVWRPPQLPHHLALAVHLRCRRGYQPYLRPRPQRQPFCNCQNLGFNRFSNSMTPNNVAKLLTSLKVGSYFMEVGVLATVRARKSAGDRDLLGPGTSCVQLMHFTADPRQGPRATVHFFAWQRPRGMPDTGQPRHAASLVSCSNCGSVGAAAHVL